MSTAHRLLIATYTILVLFLVVIVNKQNQEINQLNTVIANQNKTIVNLTSSFIEYEDDMKMIKDLRSDLSKE
jgi:hypothetical protein